MSEKNVKSQSDSNRDCKTGQFLPNNTAGKATQFKTGHSISNKYNSKYCQQMLEYFRNESEEGRYPTFELFAVSIGVTHNTLLNWKDTHRQFWSVYAMCSEMQKGVMMRGAMAGHFNPVFAKFIAVNCHGMKEKTEQEVKSDGAFELNITVTDRTSNER